MKPIFNIWIFLLFCTSCWEDVWVSYDDGSHQLYVGTVSLSADDSIRLFVYPKDFETYQKLDSLYRKQSVRLYVNDKDMGKMFLRSVGNQTESFPGHFYYTSSYIPVENDLIRIEAELEGYNKISAESRIPATIPIDSLAWTCTCDTSHGYFQMNFQLSFTDRAESDDIYSYSYVPMIRQGDGMLSSSTANGDYFVFSIWNEQVDPMAQILSGTIDFILESDETYATNSFRDAEISGQPYTLNFGFSGTSYLYHSYENGYGLYDFMPDTLYMVVSLSTVSQEYFYNNLSYWASQGKLLESLVEVGVMDPVEQYSNVVGGLGVMSARNVSSDTIQIITAQHHQSTSN